MLSFEAAHSKLNRICGSRSVLWTNLATREFHFDIARSGDYQRLVEGKVFMLLTIQNSK